MSEIDNTFAQQQTHLMRLVVAGLNERDPGMLLGALHDGFCPNQHILADKIKWLGTTSARATTLLLAVCQRNTLAFNGRQLELLDEILVRGGDAHTEVPGDPRTAAHHILTRRNLGGLEILAKHKHRFFGPNTPDWMALAHNLRFPEGVAFMEAEQAKAVASQIDEATIAAIPKPSARRL